MILTEKIRRAVIGIVFMIMIVGPAISSAIHETVQSSTLSTQTIINETVPLELSCQLFYNDGGSRKKIPLLESVGNIASQGAVLCTGVIWGYLVNEWLPVTISCMPVIIF